MGEEH